MRYRDFIEELRRYVTEASGLMDSKATHDGPEFRSWRHGSESLVSEAAAHGYRLPGEYKSSSRFYADLYDSSEPAKQRALAKDLTDSKIELQFLIDHYEKYGEPPLVTTAAVATVHPIDSPETFVERVRNHWLIALSIYTIAVVGIAWTVAEKLVIEPRDLRIKVLEDDNTRLRDNAHATPDAALAEPQPLSVNVGEGGITRDGMVAVRVVSADPAKVELIVTVGDVSQRVQMQIGDRRRIVDGELSYFLDVQRVRGNIVDMSAMRAPH